MPGGGAVVIKVRENFVKRNFYLPVVHYLDYHNINYPGCARKSPGTCNSYRNIVRHTAYVWEVPVWKSARERSWLGSNVCTSKILKYSFFFFFFS